MSGAGSRLQALGAGDVELYIRPLAERRREWREGVAGERQAAQRAQPGCGARARAGRGHVSDKRIGSVSRERKRARAQRRQGAALDRPPLCKGVLLAWSATLSPDVVDPTIPAPGEVRAPAPKVLTRPAGSLTGLAPGHERRAGGASNGRGAGGSPCLNPKQAGSARRRRAAERSRAAGLRGGGGVGVGG